MRHDKKYLIFLYLAYLFIVRIFINIIFGDWLNHNIPKDFFGSLIWAGIKIIHWCLPIFIYLIFIKKDFFGYLKQHYSFKFNKVYVLGFIVIWGLITFAQSGFKFQGDGFSFYDIFNNVIVTALVEEFVFRAVVLGELNKQFSFSITNIIQSVVFSLNHLPWLYTLGFFKNPVTLGITLVFYVVFGVVAGYMTKRAKSVVPATILHAVNNFFAS